ITDRLLNFTIGLMDHDPRSDNEPMDRPFTMCATHGAMGDVSAVNISCDIQQDARERLLFVAAKVDGYFHLYEVQVFNETSEVNIALGKPAYMSSLYASTKLASSGNDGNY
ncbi:hypothetical protein LSAT2_010606, partial [Lamellibrachia satsuma]